jgi:hypothetical protein
MSNKITILVLSSILTLLVTVGCRKDNVCNCTVTHETTRSGQWKEESKRKVKEIQDGKCTDRVDVLVMPTSITIGGGASRFTTNGVRDVFECK